MPSGPPVGGVVLTKIILEDEYCWIAKADSWTLDTGPNVQYIEADNFKVSNLTTYGNDHSKNTLERWLCTNKHDGKFARWTDSYQHG